ncbi:polyphenol oxidase [Marchantia polymorpha subsp. ruderalis]
MKVQEVILLIHVLAFSTSHWVCVQSAPIVITRTTLRNCISGFVAGEVTSCCPPDINLNGPIVDFIPRRDRIRNPRLRVRKALQCLSGHELETYTQKLQRGYKLMRALPQDDPRSLFQQNEIHCAYGSGAFMQDGIPGNLTVDIHSNWHFLPWHRMFVYFHEKILQKLLNDHKFSLHFWNFDNGVNANETDSYGEHRHGPRGCFKAGHFFPPLYNDNSSSTFHVNRSIRPFIPNLPVDLSLRNRNEPPLRFADVAVPRNREVMQRAMAAGTIPRDFFGIDIKVGTTRSIPLSDGGSLEFLPHNSVHRWIAGSSSSSATATKDPVFYTFHANVDRLWHVWEKLGMNRTAPADPDWLGAQFLFWDENKVLRRIKIGDCLNIEDFGYTYEPVNDANWMDSANSPDTSPP